MRSILPTLACLATAVAATLVMPTTGAAQGGRTISRTLLGDVAVAIRAYSDARVEVGASDSVRTVTLSFRATDVRRWTDSTSRFLRRDRTPTQLRRETARRTREGDSAAVVDRRRSIIEEPGVRGGGLTMTRVVDTTAVAFSLYFAAGTFESVRAPIDTSEARIFLTAMRRAAVAALPRRSRTKGGAGAP
jgi:hypothetical protein